MTPRVREAINLLRETLTEVGPTPDNMPTQEGLYCFQLNEAIEQLQIAEEGRSRWDT